MFSRDEAAFMCLSYTAMMTAFASDHAAENIRCWELATELEIMLTKRCPRIDRIDVGVVLKSKAV